MVLNPSGYDHCDDEDVVVNNAETMPTDDTVKVCHGLTEGTGEHAFIVEQNIMLVYKVKERRWRHKTLLMRRMTLVETL